MDRLSPFVLATAGAVALLVLVVALRLPLARALRAFFRLFARSGVRRGLGGGRPRQIVGHGALASIGHVLLGESQIDHALEPHKAFAAAHIKYNHGIGFRWMQTRPGYVTLKPEMSEDDAKAYFEESRNFFEHDTPIFEDPNAFYEEIEGRHIIEMFGPRDHGVYYFLNGVRRMVNTNVRILTIWVSLFISVFAVFVIDQKSILARLPLHDPNADLYVVAGLALLTFAAIFVLTYLHRVSQQNAGRELNAFLVGYFALLGQQYIAASAECGRMYNNFTSKAEANEKSKYWFLAMEWIAFRQLFIENFARNAIYQVERNSSFYVFYIPALFAFTIAGVLFAVHPDLRGTLADGHLTFSVSAALLALVILYYFRALHGITKVFHEALTPEDWNGFTARHHLQTVAKLVGQYNAEIVYQRGRFQPAAA
jgi:hypothetical protein